MTIQFQNLTPGDIVLDSAFAKEVTVLTSPAPFYDTHSVQVQVSVPSCPELSFVITSPPTDPVLIRV